MFIRLNPKIIRKVFGYSKKKSTFAIIKVKPIQNRRIMKTISISEVINEVRNGNHVRKIALADASKYVANTKGEMTWATTLVEKKYARLHADDEVVAVGNKEVNITEFANILSSMKGKGEAIIGIGQNMYYGEIVD